MSAEYIRHQDGTWSMMVALTDSSIPDDQPVPTKVTGSIPSKTTIETTAVNAASVAAGAYTPIIDLGATTESEIWVLVNIDQQPWTLTGGTPWYVTAGYAPDVFYPKRSAVATTYANIANPAVQLYLGNAPLTAVGLTAPATITEARQNLLPPMAGVKIQVKNDSAAIATVTVKIIRVWRR